MKDDLFSEYLNTSLNNLISNLDKYTEPVQIEILKTYRTYIDRAKANTNLPPSPSPIEKLEKRYVLFVEAHPIGSGDVRSNTEYKKIKDVLDKSQNRKYELIPVLSTRYVDLQQALLKYMPTIVHFSGHGTQSGSICLEDTQGHPTEVSLADLVELLKEFPTIKCVVLNACYTHPVQNPIIQDRITYLLIGTISTISSEAAMDFAESFYQALFHDKDYETAFNLGKNRLHVEHRIDYPVVKCLCPKQQ